MARYCDAKDLRALIPDTYRDAALADSSGGDEADAGLLAAVLESACNETDALIEGRVRLPLATVPRKLRVAATYIALELLAIRRNLSLRDETAEKISWWRNWLSKVGEGELRLDAPGPDDASGGGGAGHASSVAVRPAVTGSHGLMFGLLLAFSVFAWVSAETSRAVEARTWAFDVPEAADVFDNPAEMEWAAGESLVLSYAGGTLAEGQSARWEVAAGTNLWLSLDGAGNGWSWTLAPTQSCLPSGRYAGRIAVYGSEGGRVSFQRVAALQSIRVHQGTGGFAQVAPVAVVLTNYALSSWVESLAAALSNDLHAADADIASGVASNAAAIAAVEGNFLQASDGEGGSKVVSRDTKFEGGFEARGISVDAWNGVSGIEGFGSSLLFEDGMFDRNNGDWSWHLHDPDGVFRFLSTSRVEWNGKPLATVEDVEQLETDFSAELDDLRGELQGPTWLTPARFSWEVDSLTTVTTNIGPETDSGWAVLTRPRTVVRESGYAVRPVVERNQWDADLEVAVTGPATLSAVGDGSYTLSWYLGTETGSTATVSGQLGDWRSSKVLTMQSAGTVQTQNWFSSFASGGVREDLAGVMDVWTNMSGNIYRFTNFSSGKTSTVETLSLEVNTNFWARDCDLSGVSVWNDNGGYYYTKPGTLISSNLCYGAAHWSVTVGKTLAWYGKDGQIHASKVVDQRRMNGDLCVSKLSPPLDTNSVTAYPILDLTDIDRKIRAGDGMVYGLPPMPVLAMSQAERGWIMQSGISAGGASGIWDPDAKTYIRNSRSGAVGGDSGHPVFVSTDATNLVLLGCYWTPNGLSLPGGDKGLVLSAVEAMGADTNAVVWEAWTNYPTYLGPLPTPN